MPTAFYLGPDFIGAGHPYGTLVDAHYYSPGWTADLRTMVHILPDGQTQCNSSLLYDGPTICSVFNGLYKVAFDYHTNAETKARIDAFCESERVNGRQPHILPQKKHGCVLFSTHYMDEAERLCDQIAIIVQGKIAAFGTPTDLIQQTGQETLEEAFVTIAGHEGLEVSAYSRQKQGSNHV